MLVQHILEAKRPKISLLTIDKTAPVADAARMLSEHRVGALLVSGDGCTLDGIITERDLVREIGARGAAALSDSVADLMTSDVKTCTAVDSVAHVMGLMSRGRFRHVPVVDADGLAGVLSIRDVMDARLSEIAAEKDDLEKMVSGNAYSA